MNARKYGKKASRGKGQNANYTNYAIFLFRRRLPTLKKTCVICVIRVLSEARLMLRSVRQLRKQFFVISPYILPVKASDMTGFIAMWNIF